MFRSSFLLLLAAWSAGVARAQCPVEGGERLAPPRFRHGDVFGYSLALDRDQALVGASPVAAPPAKGAVFYLQHRGGRWLRTDVLAPGAPVVGQVFGHALALSGGWAAISSNTSRGEPFISYSTQVHVFRRGLGRWHEVQTLQRDAPETLERFGDALALDGDVLAIGDPGADSLRPDLGSVHVYRYDGRSWMREAVLLSPASRGGFGRAVAVDGERILVGESARAHVFRHDGVGWALEATLAGHDAVPGEGFGDALALEGDAAIVGAQWHLHGRRDEGAAFLFRRTDSGWQEEAELLPDHSSIGVAFGHRVALAAERALVSADGDDERDPGGGAAYLYRRSTAGWALEEKLFPLGPAQSFGTLVALDETSALVTCLPDHPSGALHAFDLCLPARATPRNLAPNPDVLSCELPVLGARFRTTVDCTATGHAGAFLFALDTPDARVLGRMGVLLARDGGRGELLGAPLLPGPLATHESRIPALTSLLGFRCVLQALLVGDQPPALTNAQDLVLGEY
ncbi:MAG TPA: hypothetical protein VF530_13210 [Planctomycetota bacterium]